MKKCFIFKVIPPYFNEFLLLHLLDTRNLHILFLPFQETKLVLVPSGECKKIQKEAMKFIPKMELCAANKVYRLIDAYKYYPVRSRPHASPKCPYCPIFQKVKRVDLVQDKEIEYGGTDSCGGDSGSPLWKWIGKKKPRARNLHLHSYNSIH